jgi:hypothetical protein
MLHVRYVHLTKGQETNSSSRQRGCYIRTMTARVQQKNNNWLWTSRGLAPRRTDWRQPPVVVLLWESVQTYSCEKWEAGSWDRGQFGNPEEGERPPLEAATKQRPAKTEEILCVLKLQWSLECVTQWDCRSYECKCPNPVYSHTSHVTI